MIQIKSRPVSTIPPDAPSGIADGYGVFSQTCFAGFGGSSEIPTTIDWTCAGRVPVVLRVRLGVGPSPTS